MRLGFSILAAATGLAGCTEPTGPKTVANQDLSVKIPAIKQAVASGDEKAAGQLVGDLESDDPAVRMYAIEGLQRLTGEDFGYRYYADLEERQPAVLKWRQWLSQHASK
jgi:hypothetical protein